MANNYIIDSLTYGNDSYSFSTPYGTCSTEAADAAKVVDCANFLVLEPGARVAVKFADTNEASAPTLNVNNTGAMAISCTGFALTNAWKSNSIIEFVYDSNNWCIVGYLPDDVLTKSSLTDAIDDALAKAKTSGAFDGEDGNDGVSVTSASIDNNELVLTFSEGDPVTVGRVVGNDGLTPSIGENGNWWIGNVDTKVKAEGKDGVDGVLTADQTALLEKLSKWFDDEHYEDIKITSFTGSSLCSTYEKGRSVTGEVVLAWKFNKTPSALTLNNVSKSVSSPGETIESKTYSTDTYWTLKATGEKGETSSKTVGIYFNNAVYYGVSASTDYSSTLIKSLTQTLQNSHCSSFTVNVGEGEYIYYCVPSSFSSVKFYVGGAKLAGGITAVDTDVEYTNGSYNTTYTIYRSDNPSLGNDITVEIE